MTTPQFFGYGSLVNRNTHAYPNGRHATARGWRRAWVHTANRQFAFLTATRSTGAQIAGLVADVPGADWAALDAREYAYDRISDGDNIMVAGSPSADTAIYAVPPSAAKPVAEDHPILLSYLDVVLQGYFAEYGETGVADFVKSTDGWHAPILNDRHDPIYPRHQVLTAMETELVNDILTDLSARILDRA